MTPPTPKTALVRGASGGFGNAVSRALLAHGWRVRALCRRTAAAAAAADGIEWLRGDAMNSVDVTAAAVGCGVIVHAANPPRYRGWARQVPAMLESAIAAARASGARLMVPASIYPFDPARTPVISETTPPSPVSGKGRIRAESENRLHTAADEGVKVLIVRSGDYFGPPPVNGWLAAAMVKPGKPVRSVTYPARHDVGHTWAYLPDLGETVARLLEQEERLQPFEVFNFAGHGLARGVEMAEAIGRATGDPAMPIRGFPWFAVRAIAPFSETLRGLLEMRYLWRRPLTLDNGKLVAFLGAEPRTPLDEAVRTTLQGLGCLQPLGVQSQAELSSALVGGRGR